MSMFPICTTLLTFNNRMLKSLNTPAPAALACLNFLVVLRGSACGAAPTRGAPVDISGKVLNEEKTCRYKTIT